MTTEEVKTLINEAKNQDWVNKVSFRFYNSKVGFDLTLKGLSAIYEYADQQVAGWESKDGILPPTLDIIKRKITSFKAKILSFIQANLSNSDINNLSGNWTNQIVNSITGEYTPYSLSEIDFLIILNKSYPQYYPSAYSFLLVNSDFPNQLSNQNNFMGTLMAYEFKTKDSSEILSRKNAEAESVINTKKDFEKYLSSSELRINDLLKEINATKNADAENITLLLENKTKEFDTWHNESQNAYKNFIKESADQIDILEESYSEKLKLEAPSHYWQVRSEKLKKEGKTYMTWMIGMIVLGVVLLFVLLVCTPKDLLESFFGDNKLSAVRWSIVFVVFISLIVAGIRMLSKLMFSSFHLSRDAEERQQLTHVYLALIKDAKIDKEERQLIMQSLFSRADTGLLKEDSAPTMPSGIDKIFKG
ncbi:MAG: hypothetical protein JNM51_09575 [Bacteroidia bacterium]|nr:hypothetical protein [Bacteroidia bacterium]